MGMGHKSGVSTSKAGLEFEQQKESLFLKLEQEKGLEKI